MVPEALLSEQWKSTLPLTWHQNLNQCCLHAFKPSSAAINFELCIVFSMFEIFLVLNSLPGTKFGHICGIA